MVNSQIVIGRTKSHALYGDIVALTRLRTHDQWQSLIRPTLCETKRTARTSELLKELRYEWRRRFCVRSRLNEDEFITAYG